MHCGLLRVAKSSKVDYLGLETSARRDLARPAEVAGDEMFRYNSSFAALGLTPQSAAKLAEAFMLFLYFQEAQEQQVAHRLYRSPHSREREASEAKMA